MMYNLDSKTKLKTLNLELEMLKFSQKVDKLENECIRGRAHVKCFGDKVGETRDNDEEQWICWTKDVENGDTKQEEKRKTSEKLHRSFIASLNSSLSQTKMFPIL